MSELKSLSDLEGRFYEALYRTGEADPEWNRRVLGFYVPFFEGCRRVLDVGCGRGEFLELLQERGISGVGIDIDAEMVRICEEKGLEVVHADLSEYLATQEASFDGIFCSNVIEHMDAGGTIRLFRLAYQALQPGGVFLVATPNPESLIIHLYEFWRDPTHVRLYNLPLLKFLMEYAGFQKVHGGGNPATRWIPPWSFIYESHRTGSIGNAGSTDASRPTIDLFQIPERAGDRTWIGRWIYRLRRKIAISIVRNILYEEFFAINVLLNSCIEDFGITKYREIYAHGTKSHGDAR